MKTLMCLRLQRLLCFGTVLFSCLMALTTSLPASAQPLTVRVGYNKIWPTFPMHVAIALKNFEQRGVEVKWFNFATPGQILQAMVAGELDLGVLTGPNVAAAHEQGVKVKGLALLTGPGDPPVTYFARADLNVKSVRDLKGKTIGVNNYGGNFDLYLRRHLVDNGLDPKTDVRIVEIRTFQIIGAITSKRIDAGVLDTIFTAAALKNHSNELTPVFSYHDVGPFKNGWNGLLLAGNDSFIERNRKTVVQFLRGYLDAVQFVHQNPGQGVKLYVDVTGNKNALLLDKSNDVPANAKILMPELQADIDLMIQFGYTKTKFKAELVVDHSLIEEAARLP